MDAPRVKKRLKEKLGKVSHRMPASVCSPGKKTAFLHAPCHIEVPWRRFQLFDAFPSSVTLEQSIRRTVDRPSQLLLDPCWA